MQACILQYCLYVSLYGGFFDHVCVHAKSLQLCPTLCDLMNYSLQAPLSMGFSRQEYWSGLLCPLPGDLLNPGIEPTSLMSPALADRFFTTSTTWEAPKKIRVLLAIRWGNGCMISTKQCYHSLLN